MKLKTAYLQILILFIVMFLPAILHAQPGFGDDVDDVPINGELSLLIAAGIGYGAKKLKNRKLSTKLQ